MNPIFRNWNRSSLDIGLVGSKSTISIGYFAEISFGISDCFLHSIWFNSTIGSGPSLKRLRKLLKSKNSNSKIRYSYNTNAEHLKRWRITLESGVGSAELIISVPCRGEPFLQLLLGRKSFQLLHEVAARCSRCPNQIRDTRDKVRDVQGETEGLLGCVEPTGRTPRSHAT